MAADDLLADEVALINYTSIAAEHDVAMGKAVHVSAIAITGGTEQNDYSVANTTAETTANITPRPLAVTAAGVSREYDGSAAATATLSDDRLSGDQVTLSYSASFADKHAGMGKAVHVSAITITGGTEQNDYSVGNTTADTTANITPRPLAVTAAGVSRQYDGSAAAAVTLSDDRLSGDQVTLSYSASFADKHAGMGKAVHVSGITITGGTAQNDYNVGDTMAETT